MAIRSNGCQGSALNISGPIRTPRPPSIQIMVIQSASQIDCTVRNIPHAPSHRMTAVVCVRIPRPSRVQHFRQRICLGG